MPKLLGKNLIQNERTLAIIKPDAVPRTKEIETIIHREGFHMDERKKVTMSKSDASEFYAIHKSKPFYGELVEFMTSGPIIAMVLSRDKAISTWRDVIGPTNTLEAKRKHPNSIRAMFGKDQTRNAVHGSDSFTNAEKEVAFFFPHLRIDPSKFGQAGRDYLMDNVNSVLVAGLTQLCKEKPKEPLFWLADWLVQNNPNQTTINTMKMRT